MKTIGIITMHKVLNYGSALQAWATQEYLIKIGYQATLIDYIYPNKSHLKSKVSIWLKIVRFIKNLKEGFPLKKKKKRFEAFWDKNYHLSQMYETKERLHSTPPIYDVYLVGSDQVWNYDYIKDDTSFFLSFVKHGEKMSYASSFSKNRLTDEYKQKLKILLKDFKALSVRESNGVKIVNELFPDKCHLSLDPTLLLNKEDYTPLIEQSQIIIKEPFILVYILNYAFNPYPYATKFIEKAAQDTGIKVVCLDFSSRQNLKVKNMMHLHDSVGPCEFLWLFANASLIITTSFHGTAFAINFGKPFYSIINDDNSGDDRMKSLIEQCDATNRMIRKNEKIPTISTDLEIDYIQKKLHQLKENSYNYLKKHII